MLHIYIYDKDFIEKLQYSHSSNCTLEKELASMSSRRMFTNDILNDKPKFNRGLVVSNQLLNYNGHNDMVTDKVNY